MIHIAKLAVGVRDIDHLRTLQRDRAATGRLCHRTRHAPRRRDEILCGGSLFWVIGGLMRVRQRIVGIDPDLDAAGLACAALLLDPVLTVTEPRPTRAFQGWRYLDPGAAPADIDERGNSSLPGVFGARASRPRAIIRVLSTKRARGTRARVNSTLRTLA